VGAADVTTETVPDPITSCLCRAVLGATIRDVLELRVLQRSGRTPPESLGLANAAALERRYGGSEIDAAVVTVGQRAHGFLRHAMAHRPRRRRPRVIVAFSGVDGAGKSTLINRFATELQLAGLPHTVLWARPGHDIGWLDGVARNLKRLLGRQPEPGLRSISAGRETAPPSRRGIAGWLWARLMLVDFIIRVRRALARADGIVVHDRYAIDAAVTLAFGYGLERPWVAGLLKRVLPRPDVHVYLDIDVATARLRKPNDPMGEFALTTQLDRYRRALSGDPGIEILDATLSPKVLSRRVWDLLLNVSS
jgi:thymidylate kinase